MHEMKLLPFEVGAIMENTEKIPDGVQLMKAPEIWEESNVALFKTADKTSSRLRNWFSVCLSERELLKKSAKNALNI
jgi:major intracellular serine protease